MIQSFPDSSGLTADASLGQAEVVLRLNVDDPHALVRARSAAPRIRAELVEPDHVRSPASYKRFCGGEQKQAYRRALGERLRAAWAAAGYDVEELTRTFDRLTDRLRQDGAVVFGDLVDREDFARFVKLYDRVMQDQGSQSLLHSYVDLRNTLSAFESAGLSQVFLHPSLIVLISDAVGGPVKVVDVRAKDAEPLSILAQDNMLHIDNTPVNDEYKVIVTWERGRASGPRGQNFVYLPGTHRAARNCFVDGSGRAWSTEKRIDSHVWRRGRRPLSASTANKGN